MRLRRFTSTNDGTLIDPQAGRRYGLRFVASFCVLVAAALVECEDAGFAADTVAVRGTVADLEANVALAGVEVTITDGAGGVIHVTTDRHGAYRALGLSFGSVEVAVHQPGYASESQRCPVRSGDTLRLDIGLVTHLTTIGKRHFPCAIEPRTSDLYVID